MLQPTLLLLVRYTIQVVPTQLPVDTMQSQPVLITATTPTSTSIGLKRTHPVGENSDGNGDGSSDNPKRRRTHHYHTHRKHCLPCVLWQQSGSDPNLQQYHPVCDSRHVGTEAIPLSQYATYDNITFHLMSDECVCLPCYKHFERNCSDEATCIPRWAKIKHQYYHTHSKHCIYCCEDQNCCSCTSIQH